MRLANSFELKEGTLEELNSIITQPNFKGTIANLPIELYHSCAGVSRSALADLEQSYAHFEEKRKNPKQPTKEMIFGSAFHDYTMQPHEFERNFSVLPAKTDQMLDTVESIKAHMAKFIDTSKLTEELTALEAKLLAHEESLLVPSEFETALSEAEHHLSAHEESSKLPNPLEEDLASLKAEDFADKKELAAKQKDLKDQIKTYQQNCKTKSAELKAQVTAAKAKVKEYQTSMKAIGSQIKDQVSSVKAQIKELDSKMSGNKSKLIANLREYDKDVMIWDEIYADHETKSVGKRIITAEEFSRIKVMAENVNTHPTLKLLINPTTIYEQSFFWRDPETGMLCKCRPDIIFVTAHLFLPADYKTTDDASLKEFQRTIGNFGYHIQAAINIDGINQVLGFNIENFVFIPVEKHPPHQLALQALDDAAIEVGRNKYQKFLKILASYEPGQENHNGWKGYPTEIQNISIPMWAMAEV